MHSCVYPRETVLAGYSLWSYLEVVSRVNAIGGDRSYRVAQSRSTSQEVQA